jgi:hypothetical protein
MTKSLVLALLALALAAPVANADVFVSTGHTGAQVQCDINHTRFWTYTVTNPVSGIDGGLFDMKRGSNTTEDITFSIFQGEFSDYGTATPLLSVTLTPGDFDNQYTPVLFQGAPFTLVANTTYTAVLASNAADPQAQAYFIKDDNLRFVDETGEPTDPGGEIITSPEPASLMLLAPVLAAMIRRRRHEK